MPAKRAKSPTTKLARYRAKRKFDITAEPSGGHATAGGNSFVVQKHAATRLHYDFRLELDGVLLSWAVPRGPSLDPADKRLAAHVEDHPTDYGGFEGTIPKGQYGGGTVMLWDRGTWEPQAGEDPREGYRKGRLKFILHGERMKGGWTLVRMGPRGQERNSDNWLLIKERDSEARPGEGTLLVDENTTSVASGRSMEQIADAPDRSVWQSNKPDKAAPKTAAKKSAGPKRASTVKAAGVKKAPLPDFVPPTLATLVDRPPSGENWLHEIKIDGYRIFARRRNGKVALLTRTGLDWTGRFKPIADAVAKLPGGDLALDGEIAVLDKNGGSSFAALQDALSRGDAKPQRYIVFDLLYRDGEDWRGAKLVDRKAALRDLLGSGTGPLVYSDHVMARGGEVFQHACNLSLEGVVSKRADLAYREGRSRDWLKSKCVARQEFVIVGFTDSTVHRGIGALALGYYEDETLRYAGRVGTGFDHRTALDLAKRLKPLIIDRVPFENLPAIARRGVHWVAPELVCEIEFLNWTPDGVLRHPSFQGLREDKPAKSIVRERAVPAGKAARTPARDDPPPPQETSPETTISSARKGGEKIEGVPISHPDRVIFPDVGITKRQLIEYYASVAEWILPHIANRPLSLLRCPSGIADKCFFQKHFTTGMKSIRRVTIEEKSGPGDYLVLRDVKDLVLLIQEGIVEIHPWGATADDPDQPDQFIFDFDPAPKLPFTAVVDAAKAMRDYLAAMKIESFCKTTGGKGLHVVAPIRRDVDWAELKEFTKKIAANFATAAPKQFTINPLKRERTARIFIDYLRNDRGSTAVAPYVVRARPGAPIALPLDWNDVNARLDPSRYTIASVPKLLASRKNDPWAGMTKHQQSIAGAQRALGLAA